MAKKPKTKRGAAAITDLWADDQLVEAPAKASQAYQLSERWVRSIRTYTKVAVWSSPVMALLLLVIYSGTGEDVALEAPTATNQVDSAGKSAAIVAQNAWIKSVPAPLLGGEIVSWNGFDVKKKSAVPENLARIVTSPEYSIEIHYFTLTDFQGLDYSSEIAVGVSEDEGAVALSNPSLTPIPPSATGWATQGAWYGLKSESASPAVTAAVTTWAGAFTSGNPTALGQNVGDPEPDRFYVPLTGVASVEASVKSSGSVPVVADDGTVSKAAAKTLIVEVNLKLVWAAAGPTVSGTADGSSLITYDLLIEDADTASPRVVAWGGAGSGTTLKAYENAVDNREITGAETPEGTQ